MEVNLTPINCMRSAPAFGQKYPYADVMQLISGSHVAGNEKSYSTTLKKMMRQINVMPDESSDLVNHFQNLRKYIN